MQMSCERTKLPILKRPLKKSGKPLRKGAQIVCLQELFTSLYFCDVEDYDNFQLAESIPGPSTETLQEIAGEYKIVIIASLI